MDNKISGILVLGAGIIFLLLGIFISFVFYIYGGILFLLGIFILINNNEDKIEQINSLGGKK
ncbi:hypothetical protein HOD88_02250 [archaeon]|jgi:hypothetical protein|nr:hypothetical protein [archaeon]